MNKLNSFIFFITPHIHNLPQVIYIKWMNREYFIPKY